MGISSTSGQGRPKGSKNKATSELQCLARQYTAAAIAELARLSVGAESETARVAACNTLLDRGYGKPTQDVAIEHSGEITQLSATISSLDSFFAFSAGSPEGQSDPDMVPN